MPYNIKKQKCKQSDGTTGNWVMSYIDNSGKKRKACHTSKKNAEGQIKAISISKFESSNNLVNDNLIQEAVPLAALAPLIKKLSIKLGPKIAKTFVKKAPAFSQKSQKAIEFFKSHPKLLEFVIDQGLNKAIEKIADSNKEMAKSLNLFDENNNLIKFNTQKLKNQIIQSTGEEEESWGKVLKKVGLNIVKDKENLLKATESINYQKQHKSNSIKLNEQQIKKLIKILIEKTEKQNLSPQKTADLLIDQLKKEKLILSGSPFNDESAHLQFAWLIIEKKLSLFETFQKFKSILNSIEGFEEMFDKNELSKFGQTVAEDFVNKLEKLIEKEIG
jgi:hypothetical protein